MAFNLIEDPPFLKRAEKITIDVKGFCFLTIWLASFQTVLDKGNNAGWFDSAWICLTFAISVISCVLFFYFQFTTKDSLLDLSVFKDKNYTIGIIIQVIGQAVLYSSLAILPQFLQNMLGYSAYLSGVTIMTRGMGSVIALIITGTCSNLIDNRIFTGLGLLMMGISGILFGNLNMQISPDSILLPNVILACTGSCTDSLIISAMTVLKLILICQDFFCKNFIDTKQTHCSEVMFQFVFFRANLCVRWRILTRLSDSECRPCEKTAGM